MHYERTFDVHTTPTKAYRIISDPTNIPKYTPDIEDVAITRITPGLVGTRMTLRTREHEELQGEVIEALTGRSCAFQTDSGRTIRWDIRPRGKATRMTTTVDIEGAIDEERMLPELERRLRTLRSAFRSQGP